MNTSSGIITATLITVKCFTPRFLTTLVGEIVEKFLHQGLSGTFIFSDDE